MLKPWRSVGYSVGPSPSMRFRLLTFLTLVSLGAPAFATKPRCKLERISTDELANGKLKVYASAVELEGDVIDGMPASAFTLLVNGKGKGKAEKTQKFISAGEVVDIVLLVEVAAQYKKALDPVKQALKDFVEEQSPKMKVRLMTFGSTVDSSKSRSFVSASSLGGVLDDLEVDDDSGDVALTQAIELAVHELGKLDKTKAAPKDSDEEIKLPPRRLIVVVSDGLNAKMDRATFKRTAEVALKAHIPIHTIAYSPIDSRGPLLNLGDLSKRSNGTFRWAQKDSDIKPQLDNLAAEVRNQYVLTFDTDITSVAKYNFGLKCGAEMKSNIVSGSGVPIVVSSSGLGWFWWVLIILVGGLVLLFIIGLIMTKVRNAALTPQQIAAMQMQRAGQPSQQNQVKVVAPQQQRAAPQQAGRGVMSGQIICVTGALAGKRFPVANARISVGRGPHNAINVTDDPSVSANHFAIGPDGGGLVVMDLGSSSGTFVNGRRIAAPQRINDGDLLRAGENTQFKFRAD